MPGGKVLLRDHFLLRTKPSFDFQEPRYSPIGMPVVPIKITSQFHSFPARRFATAPPLPFNGRSVVIQFAPLKRKILRANSVVFAYPMRLMVLRLAAFFLLALASLACAAGGRQVTDATGREITLPPEVKRVYAAGPPASVLAIAPEKLIGWTRAMRPDEAAFLPPQYANLPELGRLTGRGNTANVEVVLAAKPDLIVDAGSTAPTFVSLAQKVETQTGIPYLLLDGRLSKTAKSFRALGKAVDEKVRGDALADYVERMLAEIRDRIAKVSVTKRPRVYYARSANGLTTALEGSIDVEALELLNAENVAGKSEISSGLT